MRMARVNITVPDAVLERAREADLNISRLTTQALQDELERREKLASFRALADEMDAEEGPVSEAERQAAEKWARGLSVPDVPHVRSA